MTTIQHGTQMTLAEYRALNETVDGVWELVDGVLEQMPPPTFDHQNLIDFLVSMINLFQLGLPTPIGWAVSGIGVALDERRAPTPDMVYLRAERAHLIQGSFVEGIPDIVLEALSSDRGRDLVMKRQWYAEAGVPEYWILDPANDSLTILNLSGTEYATTAFLQRGDTLTTLSIPGFSLSLESLFNNPGRRLPQGRQ
ncbi:MAG: Uma2 family endonuclease [Chloroflexi bacterium]|nr:Uma2 family endonuclease [Chloroflexota bacterium]